MAAVDKAAPSPMLSAGWQDGDPAPLVMQKGARHRPKLQGKKIHPIDAERVTGRRNVQEKPATSENQSRQPVDSLTRPPGENWPTALQEANKVRLARAALKRQLWNSEVTLTEVVADAPACLRNACVFDVLTWKKRLGAGRARKLMAHVGSETLTFERFATFSATTRMRLIDRLTEAGL